MIKSGYILIPRHLPDSIRQAAPCTRAVWFYLMREANFADSKSLTRGQLIRSYSEIQEDLAWNKGNTRQRYTQDQIKWAFRFLKKQGEIKTKRVTRGVLITVCNYNYYQNRKNYEHTDLKNDKDCIYNELNDESKPEHTEKHSEHTEKGPTEHTTEHTEQESEKAFNIRAIEDYNKPEYPTEHTAEHTEKSSTIHNIHQYREYIVSTSTYTREGEICPPPSTDDCDFDRDRGIFFDAFPGVKTIQTFDDNADRKSGALVKVVHVSGDIPYKYISRLEELNEQGAGIYLTVNETNSKGRKAGDIVRVRAVFADLDGAPIDPVWDYKPSIVVESSPGKGHAYWLTIDDPVDGVPLEGFRALQESIAVKFGSDPKVKDLPRVMRIPGFNHMKGKPFLSKVIHYTGVRYSYADLVEMFPPAPREKWSAPKYQTQTTHDSDAEFKGAYGASQGGRNNHIAARIGGMINRGLSWSEIESEAHKEGAACSPPLPGHEVEALLKSMRRYA